MSTASLARSTPFGEKFSREVTLGADPTGWAHPGVSVTSDGRFITVNETGREICAITSTGLEMLWRNPVAEAHGIHVDGDLLWIASNGHRYEMDQAGNIGDSRSAGSVTAHSLLNGGEKIRLAPERLPSVARGWKPTDVVTDSDMVWVADGYGLSLVHCFNRHGEYLWSINGAESGVRFDCPHGFAIRQSDVSQLLIADRGNHRICVYGTDGTFLESFGEEILTSPSSISMFGDRIVVTELYGSVVFFSRSGEFEGRIGKLADSSLPGWPNSVAPSGVHEAPQVTVEDIFRSPHGLASHAASGKIAVSEWLLGGRWTVLSAV